MSGGTVRNGEKKMVDKGQLAKAIEQSLLAPTARVADVEALCAGALEWGFHAVCISPGHVTLASRLLARSDVRVVTVAGFPLGTPARGVKVYEAIEAGLSGADELDVVMDLGAAKAGDWERVTKELSDVFTATPGIVHKVIIECCYLSDDEKGRAALAALAAGADFIKTSTGFGPGGATEGDVRLIRAAVGKKAGIKAAGGIKTLKDALGMLGAGADRIGTSSGVEILKEMG